MSLESSDSEEKKVKVEFCWQLSDGRYLSSRDSDFIERVLEDLQRFSKKGIRDSILIFPPFKNFYRFLIHNLVEENFKDLSTFSVGQSQDRRTVVCHKNQVIQNRTTDQDRNTCGGDITPMGIEQRTSECHEENITSAYSGRKKARMLPDVALYQPPALRRGSEGTTGGPPLQANPKPSKQRRPDLAVYVPRALRSSACPQRSLVAVPAKDSHAESTSSCLSTTVEFERRGSPTIHPPNRHMSPCQPPTGPHLSSSPPSSRRPVSLVADEGTPVGGEEPTGVASASRAAAEGTAESQGGLVREQITRSIPNRTRNAMGSSSMRGDNPSQLSPLVDVARNINGAPSGGGDALVSKAPVMPATIRATALGRISDNGGGDEGVGHWEELLDNESQGDDGGQEGEDEIGEELMDEVVAAVGKVSVMEKPKSDYALYRTDDAANVSLSELTHVVEVFGFPAEFKTHDLISILSPYGGGPGFEIKWVDDTHALAVFGSAFVAADVLNLRHPMLKIRAMDGASAVSKAKARRIGESLRVPYRPRPETCAALAQRLITGALGVHHRQTKAEREEERRLLREAREKRRSAARERDAAWEGTIGSSLL